MLIFPEFNPIALQLGPVAIRWYGLSYVATLALGLWAVKRLNRRHPAPGLTDETFDDAFVWITLGVILGGRLGYVLFYGLERYLAHPLDILKVWQGGMSFHGGALGVILASLMFTRLRHIHPADLADRIVCAVPIGGFFVRLANFINGELWGRPVETPNLPWAMVFPHVDAFPRHPSQLYEAGLEGLLLGAILWSIAWQRVRRWELSGIFLLGYAVIRFTLENFRVPEIIHYWGPLTLTQGQVLCIPMALFGAWCLWRSGTEPPAPARKK